MSNHVDLKPVTHEEAATIALKFINGYMKNSDKERPRISIPADPTRDDDLRLMQYIGEQKARDPSAPCAEVGCEQPRECGYSMCERHTTQSRLEQHLEFERKNLPPAAYASGGMLG